MYAYVSFWVEILKYARYAKGINVIQKPNPTSEVLGAVNGIFDTSHDRFVYFCILGFV